MSSEGRDSEFWIRARQAQDKLADQFLDHPDISLIDIGYDPNQEIREIAEQLVLRVHVRRAVTRASLGLPAEIDSIPVRLVVADYKLE